MKTATAYNIVPTATEKTLNNVFDLPSTEQTIRCLHAYAGFPTKRTWVKARGLHTKVLEAKIVTLRNS